MVSSHVSDTGGHTGLCFNKVFLTPLNSLARPKVLQKLFKQVGPYVVELWTWTIQNVTSNSNLEIYDFIQLSYNFISQFQWT